MWILRVANLHPHLTASAFIRPPHGFAGWRLFQFCQPYDFELPDESNGLSIKLHCSIHAYAGVIGVGTN